MSWGHLADASPDTGFLHRTVMSTRTGPTAKVRDGPLHGIPTR